MSVNYEIRYSIRSCSDYVTFGLSLWLLHADLFPHADVAASIVKISSHKDWLSLSYLKNHPQMFPHYRLSNKYREEM